MEAIKLILTIIGIFLLIGFSYTFIAIFGTCADILFESIKKWLKKS